MFTGEYRHSVDAKGRVAIPARFRLQLEEGAVVVRWVDGCAAIFPRPAFESLASKVSILPLGDEKARAVSRFLSSSAFEVERDSQGRIVLPGAIRVWAGLETDAVVVGAWEHVEIWAPDRWATFQKGLDSADALASQLSGLGL
ncbi:MAG: division/cell wall cluster transcriptional repressor MraZ [Candidatus Limnocylindrales bacterium]|jgi:MraZ protein